MNISFKPATHFGKAHAPKKEQPKQEKQQVIQDKQPAYPKGGAFGV